MRPLRSRQADPVQYPRDASSPENQTSYEKLKERAMSILKQYRHLKREFGDKRICNLCGLVNSDDLWRANCAECREDVADFARFIEGRLKARGLLGLSDRQVKYYKSRLADLARIAEKLAA
jgi:hypothetical protein